MYVLGSAAAVMVILYILVLEFCCSFLAENSTECTIERAAMTTTILFSSAQKEQQKPQQGQTTRPLVVLAITQQEFCCVFVECIDFYVSTREKIIFRILK